jgi:uncharacterized protein YqfA (UPF0365 family)
MMMTDVNIKVPSGMVSYITSTDETTELTRNALLLYPYIKNLTISHGKAAEILGIHKYQLIELYDNLGLAYLDMDMKEVEDEIQTWKNLKEAAV